MALKVDIYKATTKYGTEHLQEDNMDDLLEVLRLIEMGRSEFLCVGKDGNKTRVGNGSTIKQIELKNYLLSLPDKTLLNGKKDIVKVLRGYIDRGQLNWTINERESKLKVGTVKKQTMSITVRPFLTSEQSKSLAILPFQVPEIQQPQSVVPVGRQAPTSYISPDGTYETVIHPDGRQTRINAWGGIKRALGCSD
jgi:hypothetical protein